VGPNSAAVRHRLAHHNPHTHGVRIPAAFAGDTPRQSSISVHLPKQFMHVDELRLELDDQEGPATRMERQDVDHAPLPEHSERNLGRHHPTRQPAEDAGQALVQGRVAGVEQAIQVAATPTRNEVNANLEDTADRKKLSRANDPMWPRSIRDTVDGERLHLAATSH
jgi:hypothetical protein